MNGTTTTFRRPSLATDISHQRETSQSNASATNQNAGVYVPPHMNSSYQNNYIRGAPSDTRYSKDQLLDLFRSQRESSPSTNVSDLYVDGWHPSAPNGMTNGGWSRKDEPKEGLAGPEMCWDYDGKVHPLALSDMTEQEKEVCYALLFGKFLEANATPGILEFCEFAHQGPNASRQQGRNAKLCSTRSENLLNACTGPQRLQHILSRCSSWQQT